MPEKRALLIGLNYPGTGHALNGCVNDVRMLHSLLIERFGFPEQNITLLLDTEGEQKPTLEVIMSNLKQKVAETASGDILFLHYSGHGTQIPDDENEESDGKDEALVTSDGVPLRDDVLQSAFAELPEGVKFTFVADCCHSGTMLDQPVQQVSGDKNVDLDGIPDAGTREVKHRGLNFNQFKELAGELSGGGGFNPESLSKVLGGDVGGILGGVLSAVANDSNNQSVRGFLSFLGKKAPKTGPPPANLDTAVLISGCQDTETSADAFINGQPNGALTSAIVTVLQNNPGSISNKDLCVKVREHLKASGFAQNPCLSCSDGQVNQAFIASI